MLLVGLMAGAGVLAGSQAYTESKVQKAMQTTQQVAGKASIGGGSFQLVDYNNKPFTDKDLLGEFALLYFGFTFCPDICPEELEKIASAVDMVEAQVQK
jgi:protein SCO1/2